MLTARPDRAVSSTRLSWLGWRVVLTVPSAPFGWALAGGTIRLGFGGSAR